MRPRKAPGKQDRWPVQRPEPRVLGEVLGAFIRQTGMGQRGRQGKVEQRWRDAVGEAVAAHTRVVEFRGMVLRVDVDSSALLHELVSFRRVKILEKLRSGENPLPVRDVRFELGSR